MILKNLGKDTIIYGGSDFFIKLIAFFTFPVIASALSPRAFGVLELITTLVGLSGLFINVGINNAAHRFYWDEGTTAEKRRLLVSTGFFLQLFFWIFLANILVLCIPFVNQAVELSGYGLGIAGICAAILLIYVSQSTVYIHDIIRLHFAPFRFFIFSFSGRALTAIGALIIVVFYAGGVEGFLLAQAGIGLLVLPLGWWMIRKDLRLRFDTELAREILSYGYPFIFAGLAYWLFSSMDRWMLSVMSSLEETGHYSIAFRFASLILFVSAAFGQAWSPYAIKIKTDHPEIYRTIYSNIFILLIFFMLIIGGGLALYSGEIISLLMTPAYAASAVPFAILCFAIIFQSTQQITAVGISLEKRTRLLATISWVAALVNLIGNYILIQVAGATGAAIATLISYLFITSCYLYFSQKLHPLPIQWKYIIFLVVTGGCILAVSIVFNMTILSWSHIVLKAGFALVCLLTGLIYIPVKDILKNAEV